MRTKHSRAQRKTGRASARPSKGLSGLNSRRGKLAERLDQALRRMTWMEHARLKRVLAELDLSIPTFMVLVYLTHHHGYSTIGALADDLGQPKPTMTGLVDRLEAKQLVTREYGAGRDRRTVTVHLTARGRTFLRRIAQIRRSHVQRALARMSLVQIERLLHLIQVFLNQMEQVQ